MSANVLPGCEPLSHRGGPGGVLVLHGFTGNPSTVRPLAEGAVAAGFSVEMPRLPGHGTSVEDLASATWTQWVDEALRAYDVLAEHCSNVAVVGLSMGGALSAYLSARRVVAGCVFINPVVKPPAPEIIDGLEQLLAAGIESYEAIGSDIKREGVVGTSYDATPLRAAKSLFEGLAQVQRDLERITAPCLLFSSREDHVVTPDNGDELVARVRGPVERVWLENSYHVATLDFDHDLVTALTVDFLARVLR